MFNFLNLLNFLPVVGYSLNWVSPAIYMLFAAYALLGFANLQIYQIWQIRSPEMTCIPQQNKRVIYDEQQNKRVRYDEQPIQPYEPIQPYFTTTGSVFLPLAPDISSKYVPAGTVGNGNCCW